MLEKLFSKTPYSADLALLLVTVFWGSSFAVLKKILVNMEAADLLVYRFLFSVVILFAIFMAKRQFDLFKGFKKGLILGGLIWIGFFSQTYGLHFTTATNSAFITGSFVVCVPFLSWIFEKKLPTRSRIFAAFLAVTGLWFLTGGIEQLNKGDFYTIFCAVSWAGYILLSDKYAKEMDPLLLTFHQHIVVVVLSAFVSFGSFGKIHWPADPSVFINILYLTITCTILATLVQMHSQRVLPPMRVSLIFAMEPVFATVFAWVLADEVMTPLKIFGATLIVFAMILSEVSVETLLYKMRLKKVKVKV